MATAIKVTQNRKDKNPEFFANNTVGEIIRKRPPGTFYGVEAVNGYYHTRTDLHIQDGFWVLIHKDFDPFTQKENLNRIVKATDEQGEIIPNTYMYKIVELNQNQIDAYLLSQEDNEDEGDVLTAEEEGLKLIRKSRKRFIRRVKKGLLNNNQEEKIREAIFDAFVRLSFGSWDLAKNFADQIPTHNNALVEEQIEWFRVQINNYIDNQ